MFEAINELSVFFFFSELFDTGKFLWNFPSVGRYFFRVLLEKLNSSMCAMCFPVGSSPQRLDEMTDGLAVIRFGVPV